MSIPIGRRDADIRRDFIDGTFVPVEILGSDGVGNGEFHQALAIDGMNNKFGFSPNEMPQRRDDLPDSGIIVYEVDASNNLTGFSAGPGFAPLVQVRPPVNGQPGLGEYAVDFNNTMQYLNTGRFIFNPANVNKYYRIHRYYGLGSLFSVRNTQFIEDLALLGKLSRDGSLPMLANLNFGGFKGSNLAPGTLADDAVNLGQLQDSNEIWATSGFDSTTNPTVVLTLPRAGNWFFVVNAPFASSVSDSITNNVLISVGITNANITITKDPGSPLAPNQGYSLVGFRL
jgi:hypothetical protein